MRRRRTPQLVLVVALCGGAALGCSSDPEPEPTPADHPTWEARISEACTALNGEHAELASMEPDDGPGARRHAAAVAAFTAGYAEVFDSVDGPADDVAAGRAVRQLAGRFADAGRELDESARAGDADAAERALRRLDRIGAALDATLDTWDVAACRGFGGTIVTTP